MRNTPSMADRIVLHIVSLFHIISLMIPLRIWLFFGKCFGYFLYMANFHHRRIVMINLKFAYGEEKDEKELKAIARSNFIQYGITGFEWIRLMGLNRNRLDKIKSRINVEGEEHLTAARKKSSSVILLSAHFGNWEFAHLYFADTFNRVNFIVRAIDNPLLETERIAYNQRFGVNILYKANGLRPAVKNLKKGEDLIIFSDRKADLREGIPTLFFNQKTSTIPIIYTLAKKYKIPIVPMFIFRTKDITKYRLVFLPELNIDEKDITEATQLQNDIIEKTIRELPSHWLWIHRKWKCYHEEIYK